MRTVILAIIFLLLLLFQNQKVEKECNCSIIYTISKMVAKEEYEDFECHYKTIELVKKLRDLGFNATYCFGKFKKEPHAWVCIKDVWIESTTGEIIIPKYQKDYKLIKRIE